MKRNALAGLRQLAADAAIDHDFSDQALRSISLRVIAYLERPSPQAHRSIAQAVIHATGKPPRRSSGVLYSKFRELA